jgi:hypothetical protein
MTDEAIEDLYKNIEDNKNLESSNYLLLLNGREYSFIRNDPRFQKIVEEHKKIYEENLEKYTDIDI